MADGDEQGLPEEPVGVGDAHDAPVEGGAAEHGLESQLDVDVDAITAEELAARRRTSAIEAGRRKAGTPGAAMAGAMIALSEIYEGPKRDEIVAISESPDEPTDIDTDGIRVDVGDVSVESRPPERDQP